VTAARVLVAPDAFKGTLAATEVAAAIARGITATGGLAEQCPVADGGEGTIEILIGPLGGEPRRARCHDPLGRELVAAWAWLEGSRRAILEMASASGLALLDPGERDAEAASSRGTGELIVAARQAGAREAVLAIGGTATTDGGRGALAAIEQGGGLGDMRLLLACDVRIPFEQAAVVFGPQKGASAEVVARLTQRLHEIAATLPRDPRGLEMTGAGGGLAGALWAVHGAELCSGAELVLSALDFERRLAAADAVVVGEGRLDGQSRHGKIAGEILRLALDRGVPVHAVVGGCDPTALETEWTELASLQIAGTPAELERAGAGLAGMLAGAAVRT
jgi:glycerate 2-kinase